jgi:DNA-binding transcriptional ArsR family regulator
VEGSAIREKLEEALARRMAPGGVADESLLAEEKNFRELGCRARSDAPPRRQATTLEALLFHPARLGTLELRVWYLLACGARDAGSIADTLGVHRVSVSRALSRLADHGLVRSLAAARGADGRFEGRRYEALDAQGNPCTR